MLSLNERLFLANESSADCLLDDSRSTKPRRICCFPSLKWLLITMTLVFLVVAGVAIGVSVPLLTNQASFQSSRRFSSTPFQVLTLEAPKNCLNYLNATKVPDTGSRLFSKPLSSDYVFKFASSGTICYDQNCTLVADSRFVSNGTTWTDSLAGSGNFGVFSDLLSGVAVGSVWKSNFEPRDAVWGSVYSANGVFSAVVGSLNSVPVEFYVVSSDCSTSSGIITVVIYESA